MNFKPGQKIITKYGFAIVKEQQGEELIVDLKGERSVLNSNYVADAEIVRFNYGDVVVDEVLKTPKMRVKHISFGNEHVQYHCQYSIDDIRYDYFTTQNTLTKVN